MKLLLQISLLSLSIICFSQNDIIWPCMQPSASADLDINNVRTRIHNGGDMWWDLKGNANYEIPKGSGKHATFAGGIWIGAVDASQQLHTSAVYFRSAGTDYYPGPLIKEGANQGISDIEDCVEWDQMFKINKQDIRIFRDWYQADEQTKKEEYPNYIIPDIIHNWPAHGDISKGFDYYLAPFYDNDNDGSYNPENGDYPYFDLDNSSNCDRDNILFGDQCLWYIQNDGAGMHNESNGNPLGFEIHTQAFAYKSADELNNVTFYRYKIINRSTETYNDTYFGKWTQVDLGYSWDDYVGCNVEEGLGYAYNGDNEDGNGDGVTYGTHPPAFGMDYIKGPRMNPNGMDDQSGTCNTSINGQNFGDNIIDNERYGMEYFQYWNGDNTVRGSPNSAEEFYYYLQSKWRDGSNMTYGGIGYGGAVITKYMYPGNSDSCGYGQNGLPMPPWSEKTEGNTPYDRRFVMSTGPFTMEPGAVNDLTLAAVWARPYNKTALDAVKELEFVDKLAQAYFDNCFRLVDGPEAPELDITETDNRLIFNLYNEPSSNNYMESYHEFEPMVICPVDSFNGQNCDQYYDFQGYQVYMIKDSTITQKDLYDTTKAILVFQCDINDQIDSLINYEVDYENNIIGPKLKVAGYNAGLTYTFEITNDPFNNNTEILNGRKYYFMSTAYAHNNYYSVPYNPLDSLQRNGQKHPFKRGTGKIFTACPHMQTSKMQVNIFPNPNYGFFYIEINDLKSAEILMNVYNINGKIVSTESFNSNKNDLHLKNLYGLETGVYFIELFNESKKIIKKVVIK